MELCSLFSRSMALRNRAVHLISVIEQLFTQLLPETRATNL
jgi:hypothetical protein